MTSTTRLSFALLLGAMHLHFLAACTTACPTGFVREAGRCKVAQDAAIEDSGQNMPAAADSGAGNGSSGSGGQGGGRDSAASGSQAPKESQASNAQSAMPSMSQSQPGDAGAAMPSSSSASQDMPQTCNSEGATRCAPMTQGAREVCTNKAWVAMASCAASETCVTQQASAACAEVAKLCVGSSGQPVCDGQGTMLLCNADGTVRSQDACKSARLCQAGHCAMCLAGEEYRCTDKALELCASDGMSFMANAQCDTAALCNKVAGMCTTAACAPNAFVCEQNTLKVCKADGTGFDETRSMPCGTGTCDAKGGDCNMCEPGQKGCMGDSVTVCDATGQSFSMTPCGGTKRCMGAGNCVECATDDDCGALTKDCVVGVCYQNKCSTKNASSSTMCTTGSRPGTCSNGTCECTKQCNKPCGLDGCGGMCPDRCGSLKCANDACVECTNSNDCSSLTRRDGCTLGVCSKSGSCQAQKQGATSCNVTDGPGTQGTCSNGICVCQKSCSGRCGGSDGCDDTCPDTCPPSTQECGSDYKCHAKVTKTHDYKVCSSNADCGGTGVCSPYGYCTVYCTGDGACASDQRCLSNGACAFTPPCGDLSQSSVDGIPICVLGGNHL
jgi:hypothetical protein